MIRDIVMFLWGSHTDHNMGPDQRTLGMSLDTPPS